MRNQLLNIFAALIISILLWLLIPEDFFNLFHLEKFEEQSTPTNVQLKYSSIDSSGIIKQIRITKQKLGDEILIKSKGILEISLYLDSNERLISQTLYSADLYHDKHKELFYISSIKDSVYLKIIGYTDDKLDIVLKKKKAIDHIRYFNKDPDVQSFGMKLTTDGKIVFNLQSGFKLQPRNFYIYDVKTNKISKTQRNSIVSKEFKLINFHHKNYILPMEVIASGNTYGYSEVEEIAKSEKMTIKEVLRIYKKYLYNYGDFSSYILLYNDSLNYVFQPIEFYGWTSSVVSDYFITNDSLYIVSLTASKRDSNFVRELLVTNIQGKIVRRTKNISYSNVYCNSNSQQLVLSSKGHLDIYNTRFKLLKSIKIPSIVYIYGFKDLDHNGEYEFVVQTNNELIIYNQDFDSKVVMPISACGSNRLYKEFSTFKKKNTIYNQIQLGNKFIIFRYSENHYAKFKYPFAVLLFGLSYLFVWFIFRINNKRLEAENLKLEKIIERRTQELKEQAEELAISNRKLKRLDQFKDNMTEMIVHDLKNPLNTIINLSQSISNDYQIIKIKQSGKQMLNMVMNILDVHKYENSKMKLVINNTSLYNLLEAAISEVAFLADQKNITILKEISLSIIVKADEEVIIRVFINLLTNAIKFTPNNGEIRIKAESTNNQSLNDKKIRISITDNGIGIQEDKIQYVFEKFEQIQAKKSGSIRSTGLGLAFCKMAIEAHGEEINVVSTVGKGTSFWFTLALFDEKTDQQRLDSIPSKLDKNFVLSSKEKEYLKNYLAQLEELNVFEISKIKNVLQQIDSKNSKAIDYWKQQVLNSAFTMNKERYYDLIKNVQ